MKIINYLKKNGAVLGFGILLSIAVLLPVITVFREAVILDNRLDFSRLIEIVTDAGNVKTILNSLKLSLAVVFLSTIIAAPLAYLLSRSQMARMGWLDIVLMIPFMTPPYISSMGWILFVQKNGLFQQLFPITGDISERLFSFWGMALIMSLHVFPFMLTILKNALLNIGTSLEESGAIFGGGFIYRLRKIIIPLLTGNYAIGALLVFVKTLSEYGTPATFGKKIGFYVFTTDIHRYATTSPIDFGKSASLSSALILICLLLWMVQNYITNKRSYRTVGGKGIKVQIHKIKGIKLAGAWVYLGTVLLLSIGIPYFAVIITSFIKLRGYGIVKGNFTLQHYIDLFTNNSNAVSALLTSLGLSLAAATIAAIIGTLTVTAIRNSNSRVKKVVEAIGLLPEMFPNIVFVIGLMLFWNRIYQILPVYNTIWMMILTYVILFLPYTIQYVTSAYTQMNDSLLMAGRSLGGSRLYVFIRITLPLILKGIMTGWTMTFIISLRELVASSMVSPPNVYTVSTFIVRQFEQGSVSIGMAMAVICVFLTTSSLILINRYTKPKN